jgi:peptide-methionine (S)-S-oxide reductase
MFKNRKAQMIEASKALAGRSLAMPVPDAHFVNDTPLSPPFPGHLNSAMFGLGCFWEAERMFWKLAGVYSTAVGYSGGYYNSLLLY